MTDIGYNPKYQVKFVARPVVLSNVLQELAWESMWLELVPLPNDYWVLVCREDRKRTLDTIVNRHREDK